MERPASAHIVLGVHLEEADRLRCGKNVVKMGRFEADAGAHWEIRLYRQCDLQRCAAISMEPKDR